MRIVLFCHSLLSDWNHGNAHFLRGITTELQSRGHEVAVYEPADSWSYTSLLDEPQAEEAVAGLHTAYPDLHSNRYDLATLDLPGALDGADLVLVHEWSGPELVNRLGRLRADGAPWRLLFHDTHHRAITAPDAMSQYDLSAYDGVLAFGEALSRIYREQRWARQVWTWHEAADTRVFCPQPAEGECAGDLVWIGNWGDEERTAELQEFLLDPAQRLALEACVYGVRYPEHGRAALEAAGIRYGGWLPNFRVPAVFARYRMTVHVPRRPYVTALPGIPTIRVFEALACGIPLVSSPWDDTERLFEPGADFLTARNGTEMEAHLRTLRDDPARAKALADHGRQTVLARHTCAHRVDELLEICRQLGMSQPAEPF